MKKRSIAEVCDIISGGTPKTNIPKYWNGNIGWLSVKDFSGNKKYVYSSEKSITELGVEKSSTNILNKNDIILSARGTVGEIAVLGKPMAFNQSCFGLRTKDENTLKQEYLFYALKYSIRMIMSVTQGSVFETINRSSFEKIFIPYTDIVSQRKIIEILATIDSKIEVNTAINRNLLEQLESLYDEWFGRFKPFNMGIGNNPEYELEEGWHIESIYSIANIIYGAPFASKLFNTEQKGKPIVRIRDLKEQSLCTFTTERHPKGYLLQPGDIVVGMDGEFKPHIWGNEEAWLNQRVCVFDNIRKNGKAYLYCTLKPLLYSVEATEVATTVIHIGKKDYDEFRVVLPPENILIRFEEISRHLFDEIVANQLENRRLATLRELLIPKLMSGEIDVSNVKI